MAILGAWPPDALDVQIADTSRARSWRAIEADPRDRLQRVSIRGIAHCDDRRAHMMEDGHCVRTVHAEAGSCHRAGRAERRAAREHAVIYVTAIAVLRLLRSSSRALPGIAGAS